MTNIKAIIKDYVFIIAGAFILALGINFFLVPVKISTGGVSGIGTVLFYVFSFPISVTTLAVNVVLFLLGFRTLQRSSVLKTAVGIVLLSVFLEVTKHFGSYSEDVFIASVFGGILVGLGVGLTVSRDASTGGSDFAAIMLSRFFPHISVPFFLLAIDTIIILISGIVFGNYTLMLYSAISLYIASRVADMVLVRGDHAKSVFIISKNSGEISQNIMSSMERGVTGIYSKGIYNNNNGIMLMCIVRAKEIPKLLSIVRSIDNSAFTVISEVREVRGEGFKDN